MNKRLMGLGAAAVLALGLAGCSSPNVSTHGIVDADQEVVAGGISSGDIRTVAGQMGPTLLGLPEIAGAEGPTRIAMSPMKNSSRFIVDMDLFMKKLRLELNRYGQGQVRFFSQNNAQGTRSTVLKNRVEEQVQQQLDAVADQIVALSQVQEAPEPIKVAVVPVLNANFVGMNADSLTAMLRSKVADRAAGKILFTMPGADSNVDYLLTGQFIADDMKQAGMVNLADYISLMEELLKEGKTTDVYGLAATHTTAPGTSVSSVNVSVPRYDALLREIQKSSALRVEPNVTKRLNVMLVKAEDKLAVFEKMFTVEEKVTDGTGSADYILSGEVSGLSKRAGGTQSDYLLVTMQLLDPVSNELLWEDGYEVKKSSVSGTVYQ